MWYIIKPLIYESISRRCAGAHDTATSSNNQNILQSKYTKRQLIQGEVAAAIAGAAGTAAFFGTEANEFVGKTITQGVYELESGVSNTLKSASDFVSPTFQKLK